MSENTSKKTQVNPTFVMIAFLLFVGTIGYMSSQPPATSEPKDYETIIFEKNKEVETTSLDLQIKKLEIKKIEVEAKGLSPEATTAESEKPVEPIAPDTELEKKN